MTEASSQVFTSAAIAYSDSDQGLVHRPHCILVRSLQPAAVPCAYRCLLLAGRMSLRNACHWQDLSKPSPTISQVCTIACSDILHIKICITSHLQCAGVKQLEKLIRKRLEEKRKDKAMRKALQKAEESARAS